MDRAQWIHCSTFLKQKKKKITGIQGNQMTKLQSFVWRSTGYVQSAPANPSAACPFNSYSEQNPRSSCRRKGPKSIRVYPDSQLYKQKLETTNRVHRVVPGMGHYTPNQCWSLGLLCVTRFFVSVHMQILQNKSFNCNKIRLTLMPPLRLRQYTSKDTWTVKGKFEGRPTRSSLASGELQLLIFWELHLSSSEMLFLWISSCSHSKIKCLD